MDEEKYQKELFEEFEKPKKSFSAFSNIFPGIDTRKNFAVTLTLEKIVFISIGIIMALVVVYALGVEMGKSIVKGKPVNVIDSRLQVNAKTIAAQPVRTVPTIKTIPVQKSAVKPASIRDSTKPYTILAVTFRNKEAAMKEAGRLKAEGSDVFVRQNGSYFLVCIGAFSTKEAAGTALGRIKQKYGAAYIILR